MGHQWGKHLKVMVIIYGVIIYGVIIYAACERILLYSAGVGLLVKNSTDC